MLHARVYDMVRLEAAQLGFLDQKPQFSAVEDAGHENGQFVFLRSQSARVSARSIDESALLAANSVVF